LLPNQSFGSTVNVFFESLSNVSQLDAEFEVITEGASATVSTSTSDDGHGSESSPSEHVISTSTSDNGHGAPVDNSEHQVATSTSDSGHGDVDTDPHGGDTDTDSINAAQEDKTDR